MRNCQNWIELLFDIYVVCLFGFGIWASVSWYLICKYVIGPEMKRLFKELKNNQ